MDKNWIDRVGFGSFVIATTFYFLAIVLKETGYLDDRSIQANLIVGYSVGFFGAWYLKIVCDSIKDPASALKSLKNIFGRHWTLRIASVAITIPLALLGALLVMAPILGNADRSALIAVFFGATLYSEFYSPCSQKRLAGTAD
ncbi:hypothetical protein [Stenotrophomonas acidaminiphila]